MISIAQFGNVPAHYLDNANFTIAIVNEIFAAFPNRFRFTSGYRTRERNTAVNGHPNSKHLTGEAADFVPINGSYPKGEKEAIGAMVGKYGYEIIFHNAGSGLHYHIEPAPSGKRNYPGQSQNNLAAQSQTDGSPALILIGLILVVLIIE
jgi:hypothetical protein